MQAAVGAAGGAAFAYGAQVVGNVLDNGLSVRAFTEVDLAKIGAGAVAGMLGGLTFGAGTAVLGTGWAGFVGSGAISGALSGQVSRFADNALSDRPLTEGLGRPQDIVADAAVGAAAAGVAYGAKQLLTRASRDVAYRYVGPREAQAVQETGLIPNVDARGVPKPVSCTPNYYRTVAEAEERLLMGWLNPAGPTTSPTHRITFLRNSVRWMYAGNSETGSGIEMITRDPIRAFRIDRLR